MKMVTLPLKNRNAAVMAFIYISVAITDQHGSGTHKDNLFGVTALDA